MKKFSEKESIRTQKTTEELELEQIMREMDEDERLQDVIVPERMTKNLYAQIAAYKTAISDIEPTEDIESTVETKPIVEVEPLTEEESTIQVEPIIEVAPLQEMESDEEIDTTERMEEPLIPDEIGEPEPLIPFIIEEPGTPIEIELPAYPYQSDDMIDPIDPDWPTDPREPLEIYEPLVLDDPWSSYDIYGKANDTEENNLKVHNTEPEISLEERFTNMSKEDLEIYRAGIEAKKVTVTRRGKKSKKVYFLVAAIIILSAAIGTIGIGEQFKWLETGTKEIGSDKTISVESEADIIEATEMEEKEAYNTAKEVLGMPVMTLPLGDLDIRFQGIQVYPDEVKVELLYQCDGNTLLYRMVLNKDTISHYEIPMGKPTSEEIIVRNGVEVEVSTYEEVSGQLTIVASFVCNNVFYSISGIMEEDVFEEILNNFDFFEN